MNAEPAPNPAQPTAGDGRARPRDGAGSRAVAAMLVVFALYEGALGVLLWLAPHYFFAHIGPYGASPNDHYMADQSGWYLALAIGTLIATARPRWRVPILTVSLIQNTLHLISHLIDLGEPHPGWHGPVDSSWLAGATIVLAWMLIEAGAAPTRQGRRA